MAHIYKTTAPPPHNRRQVVTPDSSSDTYSESDSSSSDESSGTSSTDDEKMAASSESLAEHLGLLRRPPEVNELGEIKVSPIFTDQVRLRARRMVEEMTADKLNSSSSHGHSRTEPFTQYGLLGGDASADYSSVGEGDEPADPRIFYNVAAPSSVFICGSQGSGKSHTMSCLLENCLIPCKANMLPRPLTGIVFHYDTFISDSGGQPCEAAYLSSNPNIHVRVLCPPTNIRTMKGIYSGLPHVAVSPLKLSESDLNTKRMMDLMAVNDTQGIPLYMHVIQRILRDLRVEQQLNDTNFQYTAFKKLLEAADLTDGQRAPMGQRLETLESFMVKEHVEGHRGKKKWHNPPGVNGTDWTPKASQLTIVDLSCPCVTPETACSLFNICLSLFLEKPSSVGRVVALDEAHKYMTDSSDCRALTESLLATIRLQRHIGARVVISTQEPTISPTLLDLCSVTVVHRFTSPAWLGMLKKHLAGVSAAARLEERIERLRVGGDHEGDDDGDAAAAAPPIGVTPIRFSSKGGDPSLELFSRIVDLRVGEALLFAPSAAVGVEREEAQQDGGGGDGCALLRSGSSSTSVFRRLGHGVLKIQVRGRVTADGGRSVMAS